MQKEPEDRVFLVDASRSMNRAIKFKDGRQRPLSMTRRALKEYLTRIGSHGYYDEKRRIAVIAYSATEMHFRENLKIDQIVPLYNPPASLPLYRIDEIKGSGGSCMGDALKYVLLMMRESVRKVRRVKLLSDGESTSGLNPLSLIDDLSAAKIFIDGIQTGGSADSPILSKLSEGTGGKFFHVISYQEMIQALEYP